MVDEVDDWAQWFMLFETGLWNKEHIRGGAQGFDAAILGFVIGTKFPVMDSIHIGIWGVILCTQETLGENLAAQLLNQLLDCSDSILHSQYSTARESIGAEGFPRLPRRL